MKWPDWKEAMAEAITGPVNLDTRHSFVSVEGMRLHWAEMGHTNEKVPVVLLHGLNDSYLTWKRIAPVLAVDRRVLMPDLKSQRLSCWPRCHAWSSSLVSASWRLERKSRGDHRRPGRSAHPRALPDRPPCPCEPIRQGRGNGAPDGHAPDGDTRSPKERRGISGRRGHLETGICALTGKSARKHPANLPRRECLLSPSTMSVNRSAQKEAALARSDRRDLDQRGSGLRTPADRWRPRDGSGHC